MALRSIVVDLIARTGSFTGPLDRATRDLNANAARMQRSITSIESAASGLRNRFDALAGALALDQLVAAGGRALDYASSLGEVSQQLGVTTDDLQIYRYAATQVGVEQEAMDASLAKLTRTIGEAAAGSKAAVEPFRELGVSVKNTDGSIRTAGEVIPDLAAALSKIQDPAKRARLEVDLFGKSGQKLDTLLAGGRGQIDELTGAARRLGLVLDQKLINNADEAADKLSAVKQVLEARLAGVVAANADSIVRLADAIARVTGAVANFLGSNPQRAFAVMSGLGGAAVGFTIGGPTGALIGGGLGAAGGYVLAPRSQDQRIASLQELLNKRSAFGGMALGGRQRERTQRELDQLLEQRRNSFTTGLWQNFPGTGRAARAASLELPEVTVGGGRGGGSGRGKSSVDAFAEAMSRLKMEAEDTAAEIEALNDKLSDPAIEYQRVMTDGLRTAQENSATWTKAQTEAFMAQVQVNARAAAALGYTREKSDELADSLADLADVPPIDIAINIDDELERAARLFRNTEPALGRLTYRMQAFDEIKTTAFEGMSQGLADALLGFRSLGDAIRSVVAELASMALKAFVFNPLGQFLGIPGYGAGGGLGLPNLGGNSGAMSGTSVSGGGGFLGGLLKVAGLVAGGVGGGGFNLAAANQTVASNLAGLDALRVPFKLGSFSVGGYTGDGATSAVMGLVHGREYVFDAQATARIGRANLDALRSGNFGRVAAGMRGTRRAANDVGSNAFHIHMTPSGNPEHDRRTAKQLAAETVRRQALARRQGIA